jgi:hypothetical protein
MTRGSRTITVVTAAATTEAACSVAATTAAPVTMVVDQQRTMAPPPLPPWTTTGSDTRGARSETKLDRLKGWLEPRSTGFTNRARLDRLLMLMQLQLNDLGEVDAYTVAIRDWLLANNGRPVAPRRAITDRDRPSLLSQAALDAREDAETARAAANGPRRH